MELTNRAKRRAFPSPCGEKVGINSFELEGKTITKQMFPSPCGEKVGINVDFPLIWVRPSIWRFRPLAGKR